MNVYDFDETIYAGESCIDFALFFFKKYPKLAVNFPEIIKTYLLYKQQKISFDYFLEKYASKFEDYVREEGINFADFTEEFWSEKRLRKIRPFYYQVRQPDDVVVTASPEFLVKKICDELGIKTIVGTEFDTETGRVGRPCFRESKIEAFRRVCPDGVIDDFYTDSMNDRFLMPYAKRVFLVKGNKIKQIK